MNYDFDLLQKVCLGVEPLAGGHHKDPGEWI